MQHNSALDKPNTYHSTLTPTLILFSRLCLGLLRHLLRSKKCPAFQYIGSDRYFHMSLSIFRMIRTQLRGSVLDKVIEMEQDLK